MAKIIGTSELIETWASSGTRAFAGLVKTAQGWLSREKPPSQWFNYIMHQTESKLNHIFSYGVSLWNAGTSYPLGACVTHDGVQWRALNANLNSTPSLANADWAQLATINDVNNSLPIGCGVWTYNLTVTTGFVFFEGQALSRVAYPQLFAALGTRFGSGDGVTTFNLPDERGEFFRGFTGGSGIDAGRVLGSKQTQAIQAHAHGEVPLYVPAGDTDRGANIGAFSLDQIGSTASAGGAETRPRNIAGRYMYRLG
jgi:hypothetical protein